MASEQPSPPPLVSAPHRPSSRGSPAPNDALPTAQPAFPQTAADFDLDPRVAFAKPIGRYILEDDDGSQWEYDDKLRRWIPSLDEAALEQQSRAYAVEGVDESVPAKARKRKKGDDEHDADASKQKKGRGNNDKSERKNTAIYITNLPPDATASEVESVFSKCGVIAEEIDSGKPRIKLYADDAGAFKGDALIVYFRPESVALALQMLDDTDFRFGTAGASGKMRVKEADFSYKKQKEAPVKKNVGEQRKIIKKTQKLNNKLADWDDDDPSALPETSSRFDKVVILKHMFTLQELEEDPAAILDIKEDIREECSKLGEVTNVVLFDREPEGVASVRFGNPEAARACVRAMDGRFFGGHALEAHIADGSERFKKSKQDAAEEAENGGEGGEDERLDKFGTWLEENGEPGVI